MYRLLRRKKRLKMKKNILLILLCACFLTSFGQRISNIDFDSIKLETNNAASPFYYDSLLVKYFNFQDVPQFDYDTLTPHQFKLLYYGAVFQPFYQPKDETENESKFLDLYKENKFAEAIPFGVLGVKENPMNLSLIHKVALCGNYTKNDPIFWNYYRLMIPLIQTIKNSGDGESEATAYVVINGNDEYEILTDLEVRKDKQSIVNDCEKFNLKTNDLGLKVLYFNTAPTRFTNK